MSKGGNPLKALPPVTQAGFYLPAAGLTPAKGQWSPAMSPKKKPPGNPHLTKAEAERINRAKMRRASTIASARYDIGGVDKTHRQKPKSVTLPDAETLKRLDNDGEED